MSRHLGSLVLAAALLLTAAGCSDDTPPEPEPSGPSSSSEDPSGTPQTSAPPTTEPPTPTVTPAAGLELRQDHLAVYAPEGWSITPEPVNSPISTHATDDVLLSKLFIGELPDVSGGVPVSLAQQARIAIRTAYYLRDPEILEPVEIDGLRWYHTSGKIDSASYEDSFGTIAGGFQLTITLTTGLGIVSPAERQDLLASILASVEVDV